MDGFKMRSEQGMRPRSGGMRGSGRGMGMRGGPSASRYQPYLSSRGGGPRGGMAPQGGGGGPMRGPPRDSHGPPMSRDSHGPPMARESRGPPMSREPRGPPMSREPRGPPMSREPRGPPMSREPRGPPMSREPRGPPMSREPRGPPMSREPRGPPMSREPRGPPMSREPRGPPMSRESRAPLMSREPRGLPMSQGADQNQPMRRNSARDMDHHSYRGPSGYSDSYSTNEAPDSDRYKGEDSYGVRQSYDGGHESYDAGRDSYSGRDSGMNSRRNERDSYSSRDNHNSAPAQDYLDDSRDFNSRPSRAYSGEISRDYSDEPRDYGRPRDYMNGSSGDYDAPRRDYSSRGAPRYDDVESSRDYDNGQEQDYESFTSAPVYRGFEGGSRGPSARGPPSNRFGGSGGFGGREERPHHEMESRRPMMSNRDIPMAKRPAPDGPPMVRRGGMSRGPPMRGGMGSDRGRGGPPMRGMRGGRGRGGPRGGLHGDR